MRSCGWALIQSDRRPYKKRRRHQGCECTEGRACGDTVTGPPSASQREASGETTPASKVICNIQPHCRLRQQPSASTWCAALMHIGPEGCLLLALGDRLAHKEREPEKRERHRDSPSLEDWQFCAAVRTGELSDINSAQRITEAPLPHTRE